MEYLNLCKYVFKEERIDWELHAFKSRKRELVTAKQLCIYLGNWFFPMMNPSEIAEPLGLNRAGFYTSKKSIEDLCFSNPEIRRRKEKYLRILSNRIKLQRTINSNPSTVTIKLINKRVIVKKTTEGFIMRIKRLNERKIEERNLSVSFDVMDSIVNAYNLLN